MIAFIRKYSLAINLSITFLISQLVLIAIYIHQDSDIAFATTIVRDIGMWVILLAFVYKIFILAILLLTDGKNKLDRAWNWQQASTAALFLYTFIAFTMPAGTTLRSPVWTFIWYEIWVQLVMSCATVSWYVVRFRLRPIYDSCKIDGRFCGWQNLWGMLRGEG